ncbi:MAG: glycosyltransferase [Phaeodactylibacter sp.]|uniref:glycosyltransferase family 2 protein n=1 Tax=Phaeodactylibacter sp. TaxID=1940289 RepID=UPI0032EC7713
MVTPPTQTQLYIMRGLILIGTGALVFFWYELLRPVHIGYPPLYWTLLFALGLLSGKVILEWFYYFSISIPETPKEAPQYTVDVLTTFMAGEPYEMIEETLAAIKNIRYPHETYLCDEANDPRLKAYCEKLGIHHVTRERKVDAKAGNINNALRQATGEICLILDPDHVPHPDFLDHIVPHFADERIGFVQTVQAYENIHESLIAKGAAQQTFQFYGPMMMTMNSFGTVQAIGANCTFRRKAIDSIGGHAAGLAEDMHTSMQLHAKGWKSVYVPNVLARGLVPSTLSAYYKQQLKWSRGVFELFFTTYPKIFSKLSWPQRMYYGVLPGFYFLSVAYLLNILIPVIALFTGYMPMRMDLVEFVLIGLPLFISGLSIRQYAQNWVMEERERGLHTAGGLLLIGTWWIHLMGFVFAILRRKVPYDPTPKDNQEANNWPLNIPNLAVIGISLAAVIYGLNAHLNIYYAMMSSLALLNVAILSFTVLASRQRSWRRIIDSRRWLRLLDHRIRQVRRAIWLMNHRMFALIRKTAFLLVAVVSIGAIWLLQDWPTYRFQLVKEQTIQKWIREQHAQHPAIRKGLPLNLAIKHSDQLDILRPAQVLFPGDFAVFSAVEPKGNRWVLTDPADYDQMRWFLLRLGDTPEAYRFAKMGTGAWANIEVPKGVDDFRVVLLAERTGEEPVVVAVPLRTPFPD